MTPTSPPSPALARAAACLGASPDSLAVIVVRSTSDALFQTLLTYAGHARVAQPLLACPSTCANSDDGTSSDDEAWSDDGITALDASLGLAFRKLAMKTPRTRFIFGEGEIDVFWPPREVKGEEGEGEGDGEGDEKAAKVRATAARKNQNVAAAVKRARAAWKASDAGKAGLKMTTVRVVHSSEGEPRMAEHKLCKFGIVTLYCADGIAALRAFVDGCVIWNNVRYFETGRPGKFTLYKFNVHHGSGYWSKEGLRNARPKESVFLQNDLLKNVLDDVADFLAPDAKAWYVGHGLPRRRSFLLYGPPGTGKTSTVKVIASTFNLNCCFLSMMIPEFNDQLLGDALSSLPPKAIIVLEDVDALFDEDRKAKAGTSLSFSGMLNALDGILSAEGVFTIMTTNHLEKLDKALIRGGRVDRRFEFKRPTQQQIVDLFVSFYPLAPAELALRFATAVLARPEGDEARSIATLQQHFIKQRKADAKACVEALPDFFSEYFPNGVNGDTASLYT